MKIVDTDEQVDSEETLIWNKDGFCWLRGKGGQNRDFDGFFLTLPDAKKACIERGFKPTQVYYVW